MPDEYLELVDGRVVRADQVCGDMLLRGISAEPLCASRDISFHLASDFELKLRSLFKGSNVFSNTQVTSYDGPRNNCGEHVVFTPPPLRDIPVTPKLVASIAASGLILMEKIHAWGAVLGDEPLEEYATLDKTRTQLRLRTVPKSFEMFVDPFSGRHFMGCSESYSDACYSRGKDLSSLSLFIDWLRRRLPSQPSALSSTIDQFNSYIRNLQITDDPDYAGWSSSFASLPLD